MKPSDFCVLVSHSEEYRALADITVYDVLANYCALRGYTMIVQMGFDEKWNANGHAGGRTWARLDYALSLMRSGQYKWIWVLGVDCLVTNFQKKLEDIVDPEVFLVIAADCAAPVQADSMLFKCCALSMAYIKDVLSFFDELKTHTWVENEAMIRLLPKYRYAIKIVPQRTMNSYDYSLLPGYQGDKPRVDLNGCDGQWQPGDFVIHFPSLDGSVRLREIKRRAQEIVK